MRILLRKIHENPNLFSIERDGWVCRGEFWRSGSNQVALEGIIKGLIPLICDRCGDDFTKEVEEPFCLEVVDRPLKVDESLDVIECPDGIVDFDQICDSEIASIQSEYHLCPRCQGQENFEIEY
jgi:uncharacterized metal-binding protein YceD (DUF177 family)